VPNNHFNFSLLVTINEQISAQALIQKINFYKGAYSAAVLINFPYFSKEDHKTDQF